MSSQVPEVWGKPLPGRGAAVALFNRGAEPAAMSVGLKDLPWLKDVHSCILDDVWEGVALLEKYLHGDHSLREG